MAWKSTSTPTGNRVRRWRMSSKTMRVRSGAGLVAVALVVFAVVVAVVVAGAVEASVVGAIAGDVVGIVAGNVVGKTTGAVVGGCGSGGIGSVGRGLMGRGVSRKRSRNWSSRKCGVRGSRSMRA